VLSACWQEPSLGSSPPACTAQFAGAGGEPPWQGTGGWGAWTTQSTFPSPLKPSKRAPSPSDALLDPNTLCHQEPGTEPAFFISSHLLWQPCVCLVFTSRGAWILSLLDHTRGASQRFPSSTDIFLVVPFPLQPFPRSSPRSNKAAPAVNAHHQVWRGGCCLYAWPQLVPLPTWASPWSCPMPGTSSWHTGSGWAWGSGMLPCSPPEWVLLHFLPFWAAEHCCLCEPSYGKNIPLRRLGSKMSNKMPTDGWMRVQGS